MTKARKVYTPGSQPPSTTSSVTKGRPKKKNSFAWGAKDFLLTLHEDILLAPITPVPVNNRGHFGFEKNDYEKALRLMVVVHLLSTLLLSPNSYLSIEM